MNNFDELEERLRRGMQRVPAPDGFADRLMGRVNALPAEGRRLVMPGRANWIASWSAVAAMLLVGILLGGWQWRQRELRNEREEAAVVQRQFAVAMQVTQKTLEAVQERVGKTVRDSVRQ